jgi:hypothetical protein
MQKNLRIVTFAVFLLVTCVGCSERRSVAPLSEDAPAAPDAASVNPETDTLPLPDAAVTVEPASEEGN